VYISFSNCLQIYRITKKLAKLKVPYFCKKPVQKGCMDIGKNRM